MENTPFDQLMQHIVHTLEKNGYDPVLQLEGYLKTGDPTYITRSDDARKLILAQYIICGMFLKKANHVG